MVKTYYRSEYTEKQWKALIDKATELDCKVTYGKYGDRVEIDSTEIETTVLKFSKKDESHRQAWAECIHNIVQESTNITKWIVQPKRYHKGYCSSTHKSLESAKQYKDYMEYSTGFEWTLKQVDE